MRYIRGYGRIIFGALLAVGLTGVGRAGDSEALRGLSDQGLAARLASAEGEERFRVILRLREERRSKLPLGEEFAALGISVGETFAATATAAATLSAAQIKSLVASGAVDGVSLDWPVEASLDSAAVAIAADVERAAYGYTGRGVTVAVVDSGVAAHDDLGEPVWNPYSQARESRVLARMDFVGGAANPSPSSDAYGHGTHVAGIVAGSGAYGAGCNAASKNFTGVAPGAALVSLRVLDQNGSGQVSDVMRAMEWAIANRKAYKIKVMNLSLGHAIHESYATDPLCLEVAKAWQAGIVVVVSAGNYGRNGTGYGRITSPGNSPYAITVGAMSTRATRASYDDLMSTYSSRGPSAIDLVIKPDLVAPGNKVVSLRAANSCLDVSAATNRVAPGKGLGKGVLAYFTLSGTSMAAPMVAGAAAVLLEADPTLMPDDIKARLMRSARKLP